MIARSQLKTRMRTMVNARLRKGVRRLLVNIFVSEYFNQVARFRRAWAAHGLLLVYPLERNTSLKIPRMCRQCAAGEHASLLQSQYMPPSS